MTNLDFDALEKEFSSSDLFNREQYEAFAARLVRTFPAFIQCLHEVQSDNQLLRARIMQLEMDYFRQSGGVSIDEAVQRG